MPSNLYNNKYINLCNKNIIFIIFLVKMINLSKNQIFVIKLWEIGYFTNFDEKFQNSLKISIFDHKLISNSILDPMFLIQNKTYSQDALKLIF